MPKTIIVALLLYLHNPDYASASAGDIDTWLEGEALFKQQNLQNELLKRKFTSEKYTVISAPEIKGKITIYFRGEVVGEENIKIAVLDGDSILKETSTNNEGAWSITLDGENNKNLTVKATLDNQWWSVKPEPSYQYPYSIQIGRLNPGENGLEINVHIDNQNILHQAFYINHVATLGLRFLTTNLIDLKFWQKLQLHWPADGDYYSYLGNVHLTNGYHWDVVGHEIGHAIYDFASTGEFGGGSHRIDECYHETLAFSEGWASFFSAITQVNSNDPDAKFEFMVPRRAPLEIEHIPEDVCRGDTNEWRVYAALWDIFDGYEGDDDNLQLPFVIQWFAMQGPLPIKGLRDFIEKNLFKNFDATDKEDILRVLRENTIEW